MWTPADNLSFTLDYYHIQIDDRVAILTNTLDQAEVDLLIAANIPNAQLLLGSNANFFVNGFDSEVDGVDLAFTGSWPVGPGDLLVDLRYNFNEQSVDNVKPNTINASRVYDLENQVPQDRSVLTFDYSAANGFSGLLRLNYYGEYSTTAGIFSPGDASDQFDYDAEVLVDLEARYTFAERFMITVGGENIFDTYPGEQEGDVFRFVGAQYSVTSPFGFNGAFYYARLNVSF